MRIVYRQSSAWMLDARSTGSERPISRKEACHISRGPKS